MRIKELHFQNVDASEAGITALAKVSGLEELALTFCTLSDGQLGASNVSIALVSDASSATCLPSRCGRASRAARGSSSMRISKYSRTSSERAAKTVGAWPGRRTTVPETSSLEIASRTGVRETPSSRASRSMCSVSPGASSPLATRSRTMSATWSTSETLTTCGPMAAGALIAAPRR